MTNLVKGRSHTRHVEEFKYYFRERSKILYLRGLPGTAATDDPIFKEFHFPNINRLDDPTTQWIHSKYASEGFFEPRRIEFNFLLARLVNKVETLEAMGWPFREFTDDVINRVRLALRVPDAFGTAYTFTAPNRVVKHSREDLVVHTGAEVCDDWVGMHRFTAYTFNTRLTQLVGIGDLVASQVVMDLLESPKHPLYKAPDKQTWAPRFPSSVVGLEYIYDTEIPLRRYYDYIDHLWGTVLRQTKANLKVSDIVMAVYQYGRYVKAKNPNTRGKCKRRYRGRAYA